MYYRSLIAALASLTLPVSPELHAQRPTLSTAVRSLIVGTDPTGGGGVIAGDPGRRIADVRNVQIVFKQGIGYDPAKLVESVRGKVGLF